MMNKKFEDVIAEQGRLVYTHVGDSMLPTIRGRDLLVIETVKEPLKVGDVPLYKRDSGQYVLHRIVAVSRGLYALKGDNRTDVETGITDKHIIGVLTGIIRNGKILPVETPQDHAARVAKDLIYLVSCAVNEEIPEKERVRNMDLPYIYRLACDHMLTAAVSFALEQIIPLPRAFDQAKKKAIRKLALFEIERALLAREFEKAQIWYMPLKGVLLRKDYPKSAMREMTDNDILVDSSRMNDVRTIMERFSYTCDSFDERHHDIYSKPPSIEFEIHRTLFDDNESTVFTEYYADMRSRLRQDGFVCRFTDEDFYIYMLCHTYKHFVEAGSGLRSLLDVYVFLRAHPGLDRAYTDAELQKLQISDFEKNMCSLSQRLFTGAPLSPREEHELQYWISSGSKGTADNLEYSHMLHLLGNDDSPSAKRRFLKSRILISGEALEKHYSFFARHKALYPVLLLYRPIKGVVTHPKGIWMEYKKVKSFKKRKNYEK